MILYDGFYGEEGGGTSVGSHLLKLSLEELYSGTSKKRSLSAPNVKAWNQSLAPHGVCWLSRIWHENIYPAAWTSMMQRMQLACPD